MVKRIFELILNNEYSENELTEELMNIYKSSFNKDELLDFLNKLYKYQIISYV